MQYLTDEKMQLNKLDADDPEITDYNAIPDHIVLSEQFKVEMSTHSFLTPFALGLSPRRRRRASHA